MNSGFSDFQDLLNITTSSEDLQALQDEVKALEEEVADNKIDIANNITAINVNSGLISTNTTNIANNGVLISNNTSNISQNSQNINSNSSNIQNNTVDISNNTTFINNNTTSINFNASNISTLNNEVLKKDGSVDLDFGYTPINNQSIATKDYVDTHNTSNSYLRVDGSNSMTGQLNMNNNLIILDNVNSIYGVGSNLFLSASTNIGFLINGQYGLDLTPNNFYIYKDTSILNHTLTVVDSFITNINNTNFNTLVSDVNTNTSDIATNTTNISTNTSNILTKLSKNGDIINGTNPLGFGSYSKAISGQNGYLSISSNEDIHLITSTNPTVRITQTHIYNYLPTTIDGNLTLNNNLALNGTVSSISTTGDLNMNNHKIKRVEVIENNQSLNNDIKINMRGGGQIPITKDVVTFHAQNSFVNDFLLHAHIPAQFDDRVNMTHQVDALRFESNLSVFNNTIGQYTGSASVNGLQVKGYDSGALSTSRHDGGNVGVRDSLTWDEYGDIDVRRNITLGGTIDGLDLQTMNSNINTNQTNISNNTSSINTNSTNISSNTSSINTNATNISTNTSSITTKMSKSGDTMTGNLLMSGNDIENVGDIELKTITANGFLASIEAKTHRFEINGGDNDCELRLIADVNNSSENFNPKIIFDQDGGIETSAIYNTDNYLNISNSTPANAGIHFNTNNVIGGWETAPTRMILSSGGELTIQGSSANMVGSGLRQLYIKHPNTPSGYEYGWRMGCQTSLSVGSTDMDMYFEVMRGTSSRIAAGLWDQNGSSSAINFTGQHRCMPNFEYTEDKVGLIVEATGRYMNFIKEGEECSQISCITINDSLPIVQLCNEEKSKRVFGVISREEEKDRNFQQGVFVSFFDKIEQDNRLYINGVGEGGIFICNKNGNLENGDYICSAGINGYGMRQDLPYIANYTVAKITMDCDFNPQLEEVKIWENGGWRYTGEYKPQYECITLDDGLKVAFIGVTYHCS